MIVFLLLQIVVSSVILFFGILGCIRGFKILKSGELEAPAEKNSAPLNR